MTVPFTCDLPAVDIWLPFLILMQVPAKDVQRVRRRFFRNAHQPHVHFVYPAPTLAVVAMRAGRHDIRPNVLAAQVTWCHVIYSQIALTLTAILASIIVAAKDLTASQLDVWTRPMDLVLQPDH